MKIKIENRNPRVIHELLLALPEGIIIEEVIPPPFQADLSEAWTIAIVTMASSVPLAVLAMWLGNKLIDKITTEITIYTEEIDFNEGEISRIVKKTKVIKQGKIDNQQ